MIDMDEWGKDPSVLAMRKVFKGMEKCLEKMLEKLEISPYDQRIRKWLEKALEKFENACGVANQLGIVIDQKNARMVKPKLFRDQFDCVLQQGV